MSFYLAYFTNIKNRKAPNIFFFIDNFLFNFSNSTEHKLFDLSSGPIKNPVVLAMSYIKHFAVFVVL